MSHTQGAWGSPPTATYEKLAERFRPTFARIRATAIARERDRRLPVEEIDWLREAGFLSLRVPVSHGGSGISISELFALLVELGEADSNVVQALRGHMAYVENMLYAPAGALRDRWLKRLGENVLVSSARSETGEVALGAYATQVHRDGDEWVLNGSKFYSTGCLYADWIDVGATSPEGETMAVAVRRDAQGVEVVDDWNGFGQTLTASGTAHFTHVRVANEEVKLDKDRFAYSPAFLQTVHLANLAGIGRAIAGETAQAVALRTRTFSTGNASRASADPQILQVIGQLRAAAYSCGAIVAQLGKAIQRAEQIPPGIAPEAHERAVAMAELEVAQAQTIVTSLVMQSATQLFDALGASATLLPQGLDRFWRNARTLSSHNPRVYKDRIVGEYAVNGTLPPKQWKVGVAAR